VTDHYAFIAVIIAAGVYQASRIPNEGIELRPERRTDTPGQINDPSWWRLLIGNAHLALLWLPLRFYIGRAWLGAGEHKVREDAWMDGGAAVEGYWTRAVTPNEETGTTLAVYDWYESFLQFMIDNGWASFFGPAIAIGEVLIGLGLIVGALVGIAAFFGTLLNVSFMLAGTVSSNPVMFGITVFIILGWKVAGWWGLDRWLLPLLGTPWYRGRILGNQSEKQGGRTDLISGHMNQA
jgi:thiosulfate dehydrogenase (quinone) large subunit